MNQYGSVIRTLTARNVIEKVIAPPADLVIAPADCVRQIFEAGQRNTLNPSFKYYAESNIILHRLGVFSNFADGMVWKTPYSRMGVRMSFTPYSPSASFTGTVSLSSTSKTMTGIGTLFNTPGPEQLFPGDAIIITQPPQPPLFSPVLQGPVFIVDSVTDDLTVVLTDYGFNIANYELKRCVSGSIPTVSSILSGIENFNTMYEHETFFPISTIAEISCTFSYRRRRYWLTIRR